MIIFYISIHTHLFNIGYCIFSRYDVTLPITYASSRSLDLLVHAPFLKFS